MPEDKRCKLLVASGTFDQQKKRKKKSKRNKASTPAAENTEKDQAALLPLTSQNAPPHSPPQPQIHISRLSVSSKKSSSSSCRKIKTIHKDSSELELRQATESLRWEGILQDPKAEAERLEQYRSDRRRRYIVHRETLIKQTHEALRQKLSKECRQAKSDPLALSFN
ncbi:protein LIAT1 [Gouania willdenowi]|uniref:protein LIAT1 n=1 Tax=Gouania willdenowi TaxID=441366 RepID=UPI001054EA25|nr:protein LIAT1 [Gouania willdenowi]